MIMRLDGGAYALLRRAQSVLAGHGRAVPVALAARSLCVSGLIVRHLAVAGAAAARPRRVQLRDVLQQPVLLEPDQRDRGGGRDDSLQRRHSASTRLAAISLATSAELSSARSKRLQELDRLKNEFFANVSHELRTPLTLILTPVEDLLSRERLQRLAARAAGDSAQRAPLAALDRRLARSGAARCRRAAPARGGARPQRAVRRASWRRRGRRGGARHVARRCSSSPASSPCTATRTGSRSCSRTCSATRSKFTPDGGRVALRVRETRRHVPRRRRRHAARASPKTELDRIFDRFYQVEGSQRRRQGGAGIGLSLARKLTELHGGTVAVKSTVGAGLDIFACILPLGP